MSKGQAIPICSEHHVPKEWKQTTFVYTDGEITVRVPGIYAWVCPASHEASFTPETVDELMDTVRDLLEAAKRARQRRSMPTEYNILVGAPAELQAVA